MKTFKLKSPNQKIYFQEIENDNEIPPANIYDEDDSDMDISERHGKQVQA